MKTTTTSTLASNKVLQEASLATTDATKNATTDITTDITTDVTTDVTTDATTINVLVTWGKERFSLQVGELSTIHTLKTLLTGKTSVLQERQKLLGLTPLTKGTPLLPTTLLSNFKLKKGALKVTMMGTPEKDIFVDPEDMEELPDVIDDFESAFNAGTVEWAEECENKHKLQTFTEKTDIHYINPPRIVTTSTGSSSCKPLCVLDLDHTLMDFSRRVVQERGTEGAGR